MSSAAQEMLGRRGVEPALIFTIVVSALVHGGLIALLIAVPRTMFPEHPKIESYTVDLIAPNVLGGTNLKAGPGRREVPPGPPPAAPRPAVDSNPSVEAPKPPDAAPEPIAGPEPQPPKAAEPAKVAEAPKQVAPEPPKPLAPKAVSAPEPPAAKPEPKPEAKPEPKSEPVKQVPKAASAAKEAPPAKDAVKVAQASKPADAKPVKSVAKAAQPTTAPKAQKSAPPAAASSDKNKSVAASGKPTAAKAVQAAPTPAGVGNPLDKQIAAAVQRRAAQAREAAQRDEQIAAAVQKRAGQPGAGSPRGTGADGGPISVGPGSGAGGTPMDLEFILYQGKMEERIKSAWAWAGAQRGLTAVIGFSVSPAGEITNIRTVQSSGDRQYDASCERAVRAASPLAPVPEKYRSLFSSVEMTFKPEDMES